MNCEKNDKITFNCLHSLQRLKIQVNSKSIKNVFSIFAPGQVPCLIFFMPNNIISKSTKLMDLDCKPCETSIYEHSILLIDDNVVSQGEGKKLGQINLA